MKAEVLRLVDIPGLTETSSVALLTISTAVLLVGSYRCLGTSGSAKGTSVSHRAECGGGAWAGYSEPFCRPSLASDLR